MKKLFAGLLICAMLLSVLPVLSFAEATGAAPTGAHPYDVPADAGTFEIDGEAYTVIREWGDLTGTLDKAVLAGDIAAPAGTTLSAALVTLADGAVIEGNGYALTGFAAETTGEMGLFAEPATGTAEAPAAVTVRNLTVGAAGSPVSFRTSGAADWNLDMGVFFGQVETYTAITFENVHVYADMVNVNGQSKAIAGFVGEAWNTVAGMSFTDCSFSGSVGVPEGVTADCHMAGFVGAYASAAALSFTGCANYADMTTQGSETKPSVAGFLGDFSGNPTLTFTDCLNAGNIVGGTDPNAVAGGYMATQQHWGATIRMENCVNTGDVSAKQKAGGFFATICTPFVTVIDCRNSGSVTSDQYSGGLMGEFNCVRTDAGTMSVSGFENTGVISGTQKYNSYAGGVFGILQIAGTLLTVYLSDCVNRGEVKTEELQFAASNAWYGVGGLIGMIDVRSDAPLTLTDCVNTGTVTGPEAGGLIGKAYRHSAGTGIVNFSGCVNTGALSPTGGSKAGGAVGVSFTKNPVQLKLENSAVSGGAWIGTDNYAALTQLSEDSLLLPEGWLPEFFGWQDNSQDADKESLRMRFVATVMPEDLSTYSEVGYLITAVEADGTVVCADKKLGVHTVYEVLNGSKSGIPQQYRAADAGASYFVAVAIDGIPEGATVTVTPYAVAGNTGAMATGTATTFVVEDGAVRLA